MGDLATHSHSILARWRNHFFQVLNVHGVNNVRKREIHTAEPLVLESSAFEGEMATEKLKDTNQQLLIKCQQNSLKQG
jgi:hypothetical protein